MVTGPTFSYVSPIIQGSTTTITHRACRCAICAKSWTWFHLPGQCTCSPYAPHTRPLRDMITKIEHKFTEPTGKCASQINEKLLILTCNKKAMRVLLLIKIISFSFPVER